MYRNQKYRLWLKQGGENASQKCKTAVGRFYCQQTFPPCESLDQYAVFPCRSTCESLLSVCHHNTPFECPLDGPIVNATEASKGTHWNSNNDIHSCFDSSSSITPYPFYSLSHHCIIFLNFPLLPVHLSDLPAKVLLISIPNVLMYISPILSLPYSLVCMYRRWFRN